MTAGATIDERPHVVWMPFPGKQSAFVSCPVEDILFGGARGGGKTISVLGKWALHAARYKKHAKGIIFRRELPQLDDIIEQSHELLEPIGATYQRQAKTWVHPDGWLLRFRQLYDLTDAAKYLGHQYTFIGAEELTNWPDLKAIDKVRGCLRSAEGVPCQFVATANPGGPGHNAVKRRYVDPVPGGMRAFRACAMCGTPLRGEEFGCSEKDCPPEHRAPIQRVYIPATLDDNPKLKASPQYWRQVVASVGGDQQLLRAWRDGDWNITAGGMFDDLWWRCGPVIKPFPIPPNWHVDRGYDHGDSKPYAALWFAESNGEDVEYDGKTLRFPRGTLFVIAEEYGTNGEGNQGTGETVAQIAARVKERDREIESRLRTKVHPGPADNAIWAVIDGESLADRFQSEGVFWEKSAKGPGSRKAGWSKLRELLTNNQAAQPKGALAEKPGLYFFDTCPHTIRTVSQLPRDKRDRDDVDTESEDHPGDVLRYRATAERYGPVTQTDPMGV